MGSKCGSTEEDIREPRGISKEVWDARPYVKWCPDDPTPILEAYEGLADSQVNFMRSLAIQKPGWIINRHAVPGAPHVWPEIRPDGLVRTAPPTLHWHGTGEVPEFPNKGYRILPHGGVAWADHCRRVNDNDLEADTKHETREDPHRHENLAKYCFPPAALEDVEWWHDHIFYYDKPEEKLKAHREKWHKEAPPNKREDGKHLHMRRTKSAESLARRLDVHPMAKPLFAPSRVVYFVIEGCLKADAILSAILRERRRESVFSVPSVSLWAAEEFDGFLRYLRGKIVVVVPDADWFQKRQVLAHARFAQRYLKNHGIDAVVAAPPLASGHKGVDDYLGEGGGSLDELEVLDRMPSPETPAIVEYRGGQARADGLRNMAKMIQDLAFFADKDGYVQVTHATMAKILGVSRKTVGNNLERMRDWTWIEIEQHTGQEWVRPDKPEARKGYVNADGVFFYGPEEWGHKTRIRVHERLRSEDMEPYPLG